jgi:hypothetical protein
MKITSVWFSHGVPHPLTKAHSLKLHSRDCEMRETDSGVHVYAGEAAHVAVFVPMSNVAAIVYEQPAEDTVKPTPVVVKGKVGRA